MAEMQDECVDGYAHLANALSAGFGLPRFEQMVERDSIYYLYSTFTSHMSTTKKTYSKEFKEEAVRQSDLKMHVLIGRSNKRGSGAK